ncbi:MAG TPA: phosphoribosylformylglycinamidine synthase [Thermotogota bacterium]|nr:phosphoribosylformylglycinamidine synthase [Thermotogota bacterium]
MSGIFRVYVQKKDGFAVEAAHLLEDLKTNLGLVTLDSLSILNRYDLTGIKEEDVRKVTDLILSDPVVDDVHYETYDFTNYDFHFGSQYLPGQFDQRADSTEQCIKIILNDSNPIVRSAHIYCFKGTLTEREMEKIQKYIINPVDSRPATMEIPETLELRTEIPQEVEFLKGFTEFSEDAIKKFHLEHSLAMSVEDLLFCQEYFRKENRDPSITEIRVIDTYWSDHCRHTTFSTRLTDVEFEETRYGKFMEEVFEDFKRDFTGYYPNGRDLTLMDMATLRTKIELRDGNLDDMIVSDEINACTIEVDVQTSKGTIPYNLLFKNETHNHPTEIEPFGGAATCLGGAIRDPLSGRAYVYQSMRITGSADPRQKVEDTISGKLPQRKITTQAAQGFSAYGNQIGLATGQVKEYYNKGYTAKRMECGAVIGAVPSENVKRENPAAGDIVLLIGGATGRDGCGGATGSSKSHDSSSLEQCGAEVQKGNPPTERKLQRLFRNPEISKRIKKCNDFGAGGVSVAIGELADGLEINLNTVPKKYMGLDGTELAISESQERMAVVIDPKDHEIFRQISAEENLDCTLVATVTDKGRLQMEWNHLKIVDLSREFLDTNGVRQEQSVEVESPEALRSFFNPKSSMDIMFELEKQLGDLNLCSQKGLGERFDSTIGTGTVLFPFAGHLQKTPADVMAATIPVQDSEADIKTVSLMAHGFDPEISSWSPFHGAVYAILHSCSKLVAAGADLKQIRLSLQEFFESLRKDPVRWGRPFSALLGAYWIQKALNYPAIGGKDSMSGSFNDIDVPPTLISFAVGITDIGTVCSNELKAAGHTLVYIKNETDMNDMPVVSSLKNNFETVHALIKDGKVCSCSTTDKNGLLPLLTINAFGNRIGFEISEDVSDELFRTVPGSFIVECSKDTAAVLSAKGAIIIGTTNDEEKVKYMDEAKLIEELEMVWEMPLEEIFPLTEESDEDRSHQILIHSEQRKVGKCNLSTGKKPKVFIPVFPGSNCEYDTAAAFERAGADVSMKIFRNLNIDAIHDASEQFVREIESSQILMIPGGFSAGDEPDGSGKFISAVLRHEKIKEAIMNLLKRNDGLILGICNGFQALIRLGLLPYGEYRTPDESLPTLTYNKIGRHISSIVNTRVISLNSPWFDDSQLNTVYKVPISHTEGRFYCSDKMFEQLNRNGQIATCYCDEEGTISEYSLSNPNGSTASIEGIMSPDGKILGKMGHNERVRNNLYQNIPDVELHNIFRNGVRYFL